MTDKPPEPDATPDVQRRFEETLRNLVNTPHKPHKPHKPPGGVKKDRQGPGGN